MNGYLMVALSNNSRLTSETVDMLDKALSHEQKKQLERWLQHANRIKDSEKAQLKRYPHY